jgi:hypothetical protein
MIKVTPLQLTTLDKYIIKLKKLLTACGNALDISFSAVEGFSKTNILQITPQKEVRKLSV